MSIGRRPDRSEAAQLAGVHWLRLVASIGIVTFHLHLPCHQIGYAGLPIFAMLTAAFAVRSAQHRSWWQYAAGRWRRLLLPWLVWSLLYALPQCYLARLQGAGTWSWLQWSMLLSGTYAHLWYLPFAAVVTLLIGFVVIRRPSVEPSERGAAVGSLLASALAIPLCGWLLQLGLPQVAAQWVFVAPGVCFGLLFASIPLGRSHTAGALLRITMAAALGCGLAWLFECRALLFQYAIAVPVVALAWRLPFRGGTFTATVTGTSFGIYVFHNFIVLMIAWYTMATGTVLAAWLAVTIVLLGSFLLTAGLRCTRVRAVL